MSNCYECKIIYSNYTEEFINLAVITDHVYIGGMKSLIQLNSSLGLVNMKPTKGSNWLLTRYKTENKETILIACDHKGRDETECIGYRSNLSIVDMYQTNDIKIKKPQARYTTTTIESKHILTIASSDCARPTSSEKCFAISNYKENIDIFKNSGKYNVEYLTVNKETSQINLDFKNVVGNGSYIYFLFVLNHTISRLGKACNDNLTNSPLNAYEDVPIFCSHNGVNLTKAQDLIFWNDDLLVVFTDGTASVICRFTNLFDNFEISRKERVKCPVSTLKNKYFYYKNVDLCYNETLKKCQSSEAIEVSIIVWIIVYLNEIVRVTYVTTNNEMNLTLVVISCFIIQIFPVLSSFTTFYCVCN